MTTNSKAILLSFLTKHVANICTGSEGYSITGVKVMPDDYPLLTIHNVRSPKKYFSYQGWKMEIGEFNNSA